MDNTVFPINGSFARLPESMEGLLSTAIRDARSLNTNRYLPNHNEWHNPSIPNVSPYCEVCLAGAVIAGSLQEQPNHYRTSRSYDSRTEKLLDALDSIRKGNWYSAFRLLYKKYPNPRACQLIDNLPIIMYSDFSGWRQFEAHLSSLENLLPDLRLIDQSARRQLASQSAAPPPQPSGQEGATSS